MLTEVELKAVDDWRFAKRMPSRASAVRELLKRGLAAEGFDVAAGRARSQDYGVVDADPSEGDGARLPANGSSRSKAAR
ncbi:MAG: hypothetical protein U1E56_00285 [Bauldia sp.]